MTIDTSGTIYQYKTKQKYRSKYFHFLCNILIFGLLLFASFFLETPSQNRTTVSASTITDSSTPTISITATLTATLTPTITPVNMPTIPPSTVRLMPTAVLKQQVETSSSSDSFMWPVQGTVLTPFSSAHPGIDISGTSASTICASKEGFVEISGCGYNDGYGCYIVIRHENGYKTLYAHLSHLFVQSGAIVSSGSEIGMMGATGNATAVHLHFSILHNKSFINPLPLL